MTQSPHQHSRRNLRALLILGFAVALVASIGGGLILALGHSRPDATLPIWRFGQYVMLLGLINLGIFVAILFQIRRPTSAPGNDHAA